MFHELHALFDLYAENRNKKNKNNEIDRGPKKSFKEIFTEWSIYNLLPKR